ncbi:MAG: ribulose-phosphate 3-epimerase [Lachnospiraceae bacterium]|nr:ribulose-phosphate 3-epimerase [Lachnospiraceae bacterium]
MDILSPSILAADYAILGEQIRQVRDNGAKYLHIDVMDGHFVPSISIGFPVISSLKKSFTDILFDVHLMIDEPIRYVERFAKNGADLITVHLEACSDVKQTLAAIRAQGVKAGISVKPDTPVEEIYPYLPMLDMVLVMTVEPGFGGQKLIPHTLDKVHTLYTYLRSHSMAVDIEVDGGITESTIKDAKKAGANVFVAGTAVFRGDIKNNMEALFTSLKEV